MYKNITNPITMKKFNISSKKGINILKNYICQYYLNEYVNKIGGSSISTIDYNNKDPNIRLCQMIQKLPPTNNLLGYKGKHKKKATSSENLKPISYSKSSKSTISTDEKSSLDESAQLVESSTRTKLRTLESLQSSIESSESESKPVIENLFDRKGIVNSGNTCYSNSVIQVLIHTPILTDLLLKNKDLIEKIDRTKYYTLKSLTNILLYSRDKTKTSANDIKNFTIDNLHRYCPSTIIKYSENDASEYLNKLLEKLVESCNSLFLEKLQDCPEKRRNRYRNCLRNPNIDSNKLSILKKFYEMNNEIYELFHGIYNKEIVCDPGINQSIHQTKSTSFKNLQLAIPTKYTPTILEILEEYLKLEDMNDPENLLERCDKAVGTIQVIIKKWPKILILNIKRFDFLRKNTKQITILKNFNISNILPGENIEYELYGMVCHYGETLSGGHYKSYCAVDSIGWLEFNDSRVRSMGLDDIIKNNMKSVYILFYIKKE